MCSLFKGVLLLRKPWKCLRIWTEVVHPTMCSLFKGVLLFWLAVGVLHLILHVIQQGRDCNAHIIGVTTSSGIKYVYKPLDNRTVLLAFWYYWCKNELCGKNQWLSDYFPGPFLAFSNENAKFLFEKKCLAKFNPVFSFNRVYTETGQ